MKQINLGLITTFLCLILVLFWVEKKSESESVLLDNVDVLSGINNASKKIDLLHSLATNFKWSYELAAPPNARSLQEYSKLTFNKTESLLNLLENEKYSVTNRKRVLNDNLKQRFLEYGYFLHKGRIDSLFYDFADSLKIVYESSVTKEYKVLVLNQLQNRVFISGFEFLRAIQYKIGFWGRSPSFLPDTVLYKSLDGSVGKVSIYNQEYGKKDEKLKIKLELMPELRNYFNSSLYAYHKGIVVDTSDYQKFIIVKLKPDTEKFSAKGFNTEKQLVNDFVIPDWNYEVIPKAEGRIFLRFEIQTGFLTKENKVLTGKSETYKHSIIIK
jgi:hypothetical protein